MRITRRPPVPAGPGQASCPGQPRDPLTGLQDHQARWYDPGTGRFLSEDPLGFAGGDENLYAYVGNRSPNAVDRDGRQARNTGGGLRAGLGSPGDYSSSTLVNLAAGMMATPLPLVGLGNFSVYDLAVGNGLPSGGSVSLAGRRGGANLGASAGVSQQLFNQQWSVALLNAGSSLAQQQMQTQQTQRWDTFVQASTLAAAAYDAREQAADQERFAASRAAFSNRFWGGIGLVGGVFEGVGAVGLAFAPDPTFVTKAGAAGLGLLAADTLQSSWRQLWTGQATNTILHDASAATYQAAGLTAYEADQLATSTTGLAHFATGAASATRAAKGLEALRGGGASRAPAAPVSFVDQMTAEEAARYRAYWESRPSNPVRFRDQAAPGTRTIRDPKISTETGEVYMRESIYDQFGRRIGTNEHTTHGRTNHTMPHYHTRNPITGQRKGPFPGLHPETPQ